MTTSFLRRIALLACLTVTGALTGCGSSDDEFGGLDDGSSDPQSSEDALNGAGIVPQISIRGIRPGMTPSEVRGVLGSPGEQGNYYSSKGSLAYYDYAQSHTRVNFSQATTRVSGIVLESATFRTKEGVGLGSSHRAVDALPGTACRITELSIEEGNEYWPECVIGTGKTRTIFTFSRVAGPNADLANVKVVSVALWREG